MGRICKGWRKRKKQRRRDKRVRRRMWDELWLKAALLHYGHLLGFIVTLPSLWMILPGFRVLTGEGADGTVPETFKGSPHLSLQGHPSLRAQLPVGQEMHSSGRDLTEHLSSDPGAGRKRSIK